MRTPTVPLLPLPPPHVIGDEEGDDDEDHEAADDGGEHVLLPSDGESRVQPSERPATPDD